ncbi:MAG: hypothetical protein LBV03_07695 [Fusobacteriales bacterium]|jgi:microcystin-dependent protein|nr:hypothetical protein [Fusobacteriales bacterium]
MAFIKKVQDWKGENLRTYKITNASAIEADASKIDWLGEKYAEQIGTTLDETIMNNIQKNGCFVVSSEHDIVNDTEFYNITGFDGIKEFGIFENLNIKFKVDVTNTKERPFIKLNGNLYELVRRNGQELVYLTKNELVKNHSYNAVYRENKFVVESASLLAQEEALGLINIKTIKNLVKTEVPDAAETTKGISSYSNIIDYIDSKFSRFFTKIFPVGTIYTTVNKDFDPNVTFGGTWERYAKGRTLVGVDTNDVSFNAGEKTGGTQTTTLGIGNIPSHNHNVQGATDAQGNHYHIVNDHAHYMPAHNHLVPFGQKPEFWTPWGNDGSRDHWGFKDQDNDNAFTYTSPSEGWTYGSSPATDWSGQHYHWFNVTSGATGSGQSFSNLSPYITVYFWKRTK